LCENFVPFASSAVYFFQPLSTVKGNTQRTLSNLCENFVPFASSAVYFFQPQRTKKETRKELLVPFAKTLRPSRPQRFIFSTAKYRKGENLKYL
ncbi:MAG TPA: hypothetical protein PK779_11615, partial [Niabella sp.]|nr:hypothetical protein [Niabella sp.]